MYILVTYDVNTMDKAGARRLRKVAEACLEYGHRVENSVFECEWSDVQLCVLKTALKEIIDSSSDSIRIYYLNRNLARRVEVIGVETALDFDSAMLI